MAARWSEHRHGSGATLRLPNGLTASVHWEASERLPFNAPHYNVTVLGIRLPGRSDTMDEAKARAESGLRTALRAALDAIGE